MQRYIAFLGGLPVGRDAVTSDTLRSLFSRLGYLEVETYLTTGNVAFLTAPVGIIGPLEAQLSRYLTKEVRDDVDVFIRTPEDLVKIAGHRPFPDEDVESGNVFVVLLHNPVPKPIAQRLGRVTASSDGFSANGREIYWLRPSRGAVTSRPLSLTGILESPATVRSLHTLERLAAKYAAGATASGRSRR